MHQVELSRKALTWGSAERGIMGAMRLKAELAHRGCTYRGDPLWSAEDDMVMRLLYPDYVAIQAQLPRRTLSALKHRARKLRIVDPKRVWTQLEVARLKRLWGSKRRVSDTELLAAFPDVPLSKILNKARHIGLVREMPAPIVMGIGPLDAVRRRAHDEGLSLAELDRIAGTKRYFRTSTRRVVWKHLAAAVDVLGGSLMPVWNDELNGELGSRIAA